jgi:hypothetical protein
VTDPHLEDHAFGVELQLNELVERLARARVQGRSEDAARLQSEIEALQDDLARTSEVIATEHWPEPDIHL